MLFDPKWERDVQLGPISLRGFIAWLETKPRDEVYDYCNPMYCALAQYRGSEGYHGFARMIDLGWPGDRSDYKATLRDILFQSDPRRRDLRQTFGAALDRARAILAEALS